MTILIACRGGRLVRPAVGARTRWEPCEGANCPKVCSQLTHRRRATSVSPERCPPKLLFSDRNLGPACRGEVRQHLSGRKNETIEIARFFHRLYGCGDPDSLPLVHAAMGPGG